MGVREKPKSLWLNRRELDLRDFKERSPMPSDVTQEIEKSTIIYDADSGDLAIIYLRLDDDISALMAALQRVHYQHTQRANGLDTYSRIFGHQPRALPRRDFCTTASLAAEDEAAHALVCSYGREVATYYLRYHPDKFVDHAALTDKVLSEWRLKSSPFTSGIINRNNALRYHFDSGNFTGVWSNMIVLRDGATGGMLCCPDYDVRFVLPHNSLLMFDGQSLLHGVTPIELESPDSVRFSVVFYSLKQMWNCLPVTDELIRARKRRTDREKRRLSGVPDPSVVAR